MPIKFKIPSNSEIENKIAGEIKSKIEHALNPLISQLSEATIIINIINGKINIKLQDVPDYLLSQVEDLIRQAQ